jgi:Holliday junction resolvase
MGKMQREKGARFERAVVEAAKAYGLDARRTSMTQSGSDSEEADVLVAGKRVECKHRERLSIELWEWQEGVDFVVLKRNGKEPLAVLPMTKLFEMLKGGTIGS